MYVISQGAKEHSAEEIAQEAILKAIETTFRDNDQDTIVSWIYWKAKNLTIDRYRKRSSSEAADTDLVSDNAKSVNSNPLDGLIDQELKRQLKDCLELLSNTEQNVVSLVLDNYSYEEVSESINNSVNACHKAMSRARVKLKTCLEGKQS